MSDEDINHKNVTKTSTWQECIKDTDCVVFGTAHDDIASIKMDEICQSIRSDGLVFDGRRYLNKSEVSILKESGISCMGVGRSFS